jgi:hypothetical protein
MSNLDRRQFLKGILDRLAQVAGSVVVASATASMARAQAGQSDQAERPEDLQERADRLAAAANLSAEETEAATFEFRNGAFVNTPLGGFGNSPIGGFRNTPLGAFRNTPLDTFRNRPLGAFRNGISDNMFRNGPLGPFANGGWRNNPWGGFQNGGWPNGGWQNWW